MRSWGIGWTYRQLVAFQKRNRLRWFGRVERKEKEVRWGNGWGNARTWRVRGKEGGRERHGWKWSRMIWKVWASRCGCSGPSFAWSLPGIIPRMSGFKNGACVTFYWALLHKKWGMCHFLLSIVTQKMGHVSLFIEHCYTTTHFVFDS